MSQLTTYGNDIKRLHMKAQQHAASAIQCAMEAGQLLIDAKSQVNHGDWLPFVESTGINQRTARNYMHLARNRDLLKSATVADMGIKKALEYLAEPKALPSDDFHPPIMGEYLEFISRRYYEFVWLNDEDSYLYIYGYPFYSEQGEEMGYPMIHTPLKAVSWAGIRDRVSSIGKMTRKTGSPLFAWLMLKGCLTREPDDTESMRDPGYKVLGLDFSGIEIRQKTPPLQRR